MAVSLSKETASPAGSNTALSLKRGGAERGVQDQMAVFTNGISMHVCRAVRRARQTVRLRSEPPQDAAMACAWSEANNNQLATGCGDGSVKMWDLGPHMGGRPWRSYSEHQKEASGVSFGIGASRSLLLSCSWDTSVKMWDPGASQGSISTWREHTGSVYAVRFSPKSPTAFATCGGDR